MNLLPKHLLAGSNKCTIGCKEVQICTFVFAEALQKNKSKKQLLAETLIIQKKS